MLHLPAKRKRTSAEIIAQGGHGRTLMAEENQCRDRFDRTPVIARRSGESVNAVEGHGAPS